MRGCHLRHPRVVLEDARDQVLGAAVHPLEQQRGVRVEQLRLHEDVVVRLLDGEERGASGRARARGGAGVGGRGQGEVGARLGARDVGGEISPWRLAARGAAPRGAGRPRSLRTATMTQLP